MYEQRLRRSSHLFDSDRQASLDQAARSAAPFSSDSPLDTTRAGRRNRAAATKSAKRQPRRQKARSVSPTADWTVMVYMAGNTLEGYGIQDFLEMANVGSDSRINLVVQFDRTAGANSSYGNWTDTRRGLIRAGDKPNAFWGDRLGELNTGSATTLKDFVDWGTSTYKANRYALVMWGHGDGFNVSYDDNTGDGISGSELSSVLSSTGNKIELVGTDACLMATTEFAYQIADNASIFVGSQELEPGTGWNYTTTLQDLKANPTMTAAQLGSSIVTRYGQAYPAGNETFSAINLLALRSSNASSLTNALNTFASTALTSATISDLTVLDSLRDYFANDFGDATYRGSEDLCDVGNLFSNLVNRLDISAAVRTAAQSVLTAYSSTILQNYSATPGRSTGLSLYFSDRSATPKLNYTSRLYGFLASTQWDEFLQGWLWS